jgi:hypothetical protein
MLDRLSGVWVVRTAMRQLLVLLVAISERKRIPYVKRKKTLPESTQKLLRSC